MSDPNHAATTPHAGTNSGQVVVVRKDSLSTKIVLILVAVVLIVLAALLAVYFVPRWWAHRIGDVSDGHFTSATFAGLTCGFVFTAVPLLMLRRVVARHGSMGARVIWLILAALVAAPNLTTLGIVLGNGNGAHAARRTLDVQAPGFRWATLYGAVLAAAFVVMIWTLLAGRHRRKAQLVAKDAELARLRDEVSHRPADEKVAQPKPQPHRPGAE